MLAKTTMQRNATGQAASALRPPGTKNHKLTRKLFGGHSIFPAWPQESGKDICSTDIFSLPVDHTECDEEIHFLILNLRDLHSRAATPLASYSSHVRLGSHCFTRRS